MSASKRNNMRQFLGCNLGLKWFSVHIKPLSVSKSRIQLTQNSKTVCFWYFFMTTVKWLESSEYVCIHTTTAFQATQQWCNIDGVLEAVGSCVMVLTIAPGGRGGWGGSACDVIISRRWSKGIVIAPMQYSAWLNLFISALTPAALLHTRMQDCDVTFWENRKDKSGLTSLPEHEKMLTY